MTRPLLIVMGVSGVGKTTLARALADRLGLPFAEGDELHSPEAVAKMRGGTPLTDDDRAPWLDRCAAVLAGWRAAGTGGVLTCSALRRRYRDRLRAGVGGALRILFLRADRATLAARLERRRDHYMPPGLLGSQLDALEVPGTEEGVVSVAADGAPETVLSAALRELRHGAVVIPPPG